MRKLSMFNNVSLDGFFTDAGGDMSWAHHRDSEWDRFSRENASGRAALLFGRKTYEQMAGFWPTPQALQTMPDIANAMNSMPKTVFSRTLDEVHWQNSRLAKGNVVDEVRRMKAEPGPGLLILGSGEIVAQLAQADLIDDFQLVIVPIILGDGRSLFAGVGNRPRLRLTKTRSFSNGNVVNWYQRA